MIDELENLTLNLEKLEELDNKKFSSNNFKEVNRQLEDVVSQLMSKFNMYQENVLSTQEQALFINIVNKIEKLELKILPKANILNSFSKSII